MEYRLLKNGQKISTIGIGVGNYGYANVPLAEIEKIFLTAFDGGVNFFDTCMSASWPAEAVRKVIEGRRDRLIMQTICVSAIPTAAITTSKIWQASRMPLPMS